jgi:hypothetical protein
MGSARPSVTASSTDIVKEVDGCTYWEVGRGCGADEIWTRSAGINKCWKMTQW